MSHGCRLQVVARNLLSTAMLAGSLAAGGCWTEGGRGYSNDSYTYISREWEPKTISVIDTRTGQAVWSYEVPVGRQLIMEFFQGGSGDATLPDRLHWGDRDAGTLFGLPENSVNVPSASARRVDMKLRPVPEAEKIATSSAPAAAHNGQ